MHTPTVTQLFRTVFYQTEFSSDQEFEEYKKRADAWWKENHFESKEDYEFRVQFNNRPQLGAVIIS